MSVIQAISYCPTDCQEGHDGVSVTSSAAAVFSTAYGPTGCLNSRGHCFVSNTGSNPLEFSPNGTTWGIFVPAGQTLQLPYCGSPTWKSASGTTAAVYGFALAATPKTYANT